MDYKTARSEFLSLFGKLDENEKCRFSRWVGGYCTAQIESLPPTQNEELLDTISDELRKHVDVPGGKISGEIVSIRNLFLICTTLHNINLNVWQIPYQK